MVFSLLSSTLWVYSLLVIFNTLSWSLETYFIVHSSTYFGLLLLSTFFSCYWVFQSCQSVSSVTHLSPTLCDPMDCSMPGLPAHHQLPEPTQTHVHWVGDAIQPSHPLSAPSLPPSIFPSIRVFSNDSVLRIRWLKYWNFSFSISPSNKYSGLISLTMDQLDLLAVQGTLKSLQHH